ncbi:50S ribosomal protein L3 [Patescibacteria group bacterium]
MTYLIGEKIEMQQQFDKNGNSIPVTVLRVGPCAVTQVKVADKDGVNAIQVGFGKKKKPSKPLAGHLKGIDGFAVLKEFQVDDPSKFKRGQVLTVEDFKEGEKVSIRGTSKGKGFQGVVKRHGFHGSPASHGHKDQLRMPGSIGATDMAKVMKGMRMAGRMGGQNATSQNISVITVNAKENLLHVKGAVPGARHSIVSIESVS